MPIVGHAFVGLATAICVKPARSALTAYWTTIVVALAYLPDIANQATRYLGIPDQTVITHSLLFALVASTVVGLLLAKVGSLPFRMIFLISLVSIAGHDVLDFLQSTGRQPWWPILNQTTPASWQVIPHAIVTESVIFGTVFLLAVTLVAAIRRSSSHVVDVNSSTQVSSAVHSWINRLLVLTLLCSAFGTHHLRAVRQRDYESARSLLENHDYYAALTTATKARPWPSTAKPGRVEYLMAQAYAGIGDRKRAKEYYLASIQANPRYFWSTADLAVLYATSSESVEERRRLASPHIQKLQSDFSRHADLARVLVKIEQKLNSPAP